MITRRSVASSALASRDCDAIAKAPACKYAQRMSDLKLPGEDNKKKISLARISIWVFVGAVGAYLLITGIVGIIVKG
jgi:hypothetical protein